VSIKNRQKFLVSVAGFAPEKSLRGVLSGLAKFSAALIFQFSPPAG
jgi:hypothetical protein